MPSSYYPHAIPQQNFIYGCCNVYCTFVLKMRSFDFQALSCGFST